MKALISRLVLAVLLVPTWAQAATIIADGDGTGTGYDCTFNCVVRYQQVYTASLFSGITNIEAVQFKAGEFLGWSSNTYTATLSTAVNGVNSLSATFADNVGSDASLFQTKSFTGFLYAGDLFGFSGSFIYDPSMGDLLVDIVRVSGASQTGGSIYNFGTQTLDEYSRMWSMTSTVTGEGQYDQAVGLHTYFTTSIVPIPTAAWLFLSALGGLGIIKRKRS